MRARVVLFASLLAIAPFARADDYVLELPANEPSLKDARFLSVYDGTSKLRTGDRVIRITFGAATEGGSIKVAAGVAKDSKALLASAGDVDGFKGEVQLAGGAAPQRSYGAKLIPAALAPKPKPPADEGGGIPWMYIACGVGGAFVAAAGYKLLSSSALNGGGTAVGPTINLKHIERSLDKIHHFIAKHTEGGGGGSADYSKQLDELGRGLTAVAERLIALEGAMKAQGSLGSASGEAPAPSAELERLAAQGERTEAALNSLMQMLGSLSADFAKNPEALAQNPDAANARQESFEGLKASIESLEARLAAIATTSEAALAGVTALQQAGPGEAPDGTVLKNLSNSVEALAQSQSSMESEVRGLSAGLGQLAAHPPQVDLRPITDKIESLASQSAQVDLRPIVEKLDALATRPTADPGLEPMRAKLDATFDLLAAYDARISQLQASLNAQPTAPAQDWSPSFAQLEAKLEQLSTGLAAQESGLARIAEAAAAQAPQTPDFGPLVDQLSASQAALVPIANSVASLETHLGEVAARQASYEAKLEALNASIGALASGGNMSTEAAAAALQQSSAGLSSIAEAIGSLKNDAASNATQLAALEARLGSFESLLQSGSQAHPETAESIRETRQAISQLGESLGWLERKLGEIAQGSSQADAMVEAVRTQLAEWEAKQAAAGARFESEQLAAVSQAFADLGKSVSELKSGLESLSERSQRTDQGVEALREIVAALSSATGADSTALDQHWEQWRASQASIAGVAESVQSFAPALENLQARATAFDERIEELKALVQANSGAAAGSEHLAEQLAEIREAIAGAPTALAEFSEKFSSFEAEHAALRNEVAALGSSISSGAPTTSGEFDASPMASILEKLEQQASSLSQRLSSAEAGLAAACDRAASLQDMLDEMARGAVAPASPKREKQRQFEAPESIEHHVEQPSVDESRITIEDVADAKLLNEFISADDEPKEQPRYSLELEVEQFDAQSEDDSGLLTDEHTPAWSWACAGGGPERHGCLDSRIPLKMRDKERAAKPLTPPDTPDCSSPLRNLLYAMGWVVYSHGDTVRGFWPGKDPRQAHLQGEIPEGAWRLMVHNGTAYAALADRVEMVNLTTWSRQNGFTGEFVDQVHTLTHWIGVAKNGELLHVEYRDGGGKQVGVPVPVDIYPDEYASCLCDGEKVYLADRKGRVVRVESGKVQEVGTFGKQGELRFFALHGKELVATMRTESGTFVRTMDLSGGHQKEIALNTKSVSEQAVLMGDRLYLVDGASGELLACSLSKHKLLSRKPLPGVQAARWLAGIRKNDQARLLLVSLDGSNHTGAALIVDPESGATLSLGAVGAHTAAEFIPADGRVVLATSTSYQNIVRVFEPFEAASAKAAA